MSSVISLKGCIHQYGGQLQHAPAELVYIGRAFTMGGWNLPQSKWANPYNVKHYGRDGALELYRRYILNSPHLLEALPELANKTLGCWCHPESCHGHILLTLYNTSINQ